MIFKIQQSFLCFLGVFGILKFDKGHQILLRNEGFGNSAPSLSLSLRKLKEQRDSGTRDFKNGGHVWGLREGLHIW